MQQLESVVQQLKSRLSNQPSDLATSAFTQHASMQDSEIHLKTVQGTHTQSSRPLCIDEQSHRYATHSLWSELERQGLSHSSSRASPVPFQGDSFATSINTNTLHPRPEQVFALWQIYTDNVDVVLKLLHTPTTQRLISKATLDRTTIKPSTECLLFAIYYSAVASLPAEQHHIQLLQEDRSVALERYRLGMNESLDRARFMDTRDLTVLQAFVLFLICARSEGKTPVWALTSVAVRIAMRLGLNHDPQTQQYSPFECEMRRRLWWHIMTLDVRCAEDADLDPLISEYQFDTKFPTNVNDADLHDGMKQYPLPAAGRTEMLYTLTRFHVHYAVRKFMFSDMFTIGNQYTRAGQEQNRVALIDELEQEIDRDWFRECDPGLPICFTTITSIHLVLAKLRLVLQRPASLELLGKEQVLNNHIMQNSVEIITHTQALRGSKQHQRWTWLFQRYIEWDALAMLLCSILASQSVLVPAEVYTAVDDCIHTWKDVHLDEIHERRWKRILALNAQVRATKIRTPLGTPPPQCGSTKDDGILTTDQRSQDVVTDIVPIRTNTLTSTGLLCTPHTSLPIDTNIILQNWEFDDIATAAQGVFSWDLDFNSPDVSTWI